MAGIGSRFSSPVGEVNGRVIACRTRTLYRSRVSRSTNSAARVTVNPSGALDAVRSEHVPPFTERFDVDELLGEGGMGRVFVAHDRGLGRNVAMKQLHEALERDHDAVRRFVLEAQIGAQLTHPNILPLYSFERSKGGAPAFAMQLVDGQTLADYIEEAAKAPPDARKPGGAFSLKERIGMLLGACDAVSFAHQRGVIHRDLKPDNVMLGRHREIYVMDWGIARVLDEEDDALVPPGRVAPRDAPAPSADDELAHAKTAYASSGSGPKPTQQGDVLGTPAYMAPEQAQGDLIVLGAPADQFALGAVLAELATLLPVRTSSSLAAVLAQAAAGDLDVGADVDGAPLDPALAAIIARATAKGPLDRYPSVDAMAEDLRRFIRDEPVSVYREPAAKRALRAASRRPALTVGVVAALLLALAGVAIANLVRAERAAEHHAREIEGTKRLLVAVGERAHAVDVWFSDVVGGLDRLAAATEQALDHPMGSEHSVLPPPPPLTPSPRHGGAVSFESPFVSSGGAEAGSHASADALRLVAITPWLRGALEAGLPPGEIDAGAEARQRSVAQGHSTLLRSYVGLTSDGSFVQYPARMPPAGFDPRRRPWYRTAASSSWHVWTPPMLSMEGETVRIAAVVQLRSKEKFVGVAGIDIRVPEVAARLKLDAPGFRRAYLVMPDGKVAVADDLEARFIGKGIGPDSDLALPAVDEPRLAERIARGEAGGFFRSGDKVVVFSRMVSPPWTYVAELDAALYSGD